jgi:anti-sigma regulatory factor (Ser/Thr protein kinase)
MSAFAIGSESAPHTAPDYALSVPAESRYIATARFFGSTVARLFDCDSEVVEDLKIALSDALGSAIKLDPADGRSDPITITARHVPGSVSFTIVAPGSEIALVGSIDNSFDSGSYGLAVIRALFDDARFERIPGGITIFFSAPAGH